MGNSIISVKGASNLKKTRGSSLVKYMRNSLMAILVMIAHNNKASGQANVPPFLDSIMQAGLNVGETASIQIGTESDHPWLLSLYENAQQNEANNILITITTVQGQVIELFADGSNGNFYNIVGGEDFKVTGLAKAGSEDCTNMTPDHIDFIDQTNGLGFDGEICVASSVLALGFIGGDVDQTRDNSDQFRVYFEAVNLVNTGKIHVRASNRIFRPGVDDPKTFGQTLYTIDGPAGGNASKFFFNKVVTLDMQALHAADHDGDNIKSVNDKKVYVSYIEEETGDSGAFNAYPQLDVLKFKYDFSPPKIFPNPVSQSEGIHYDVPSAFQDGCTIELLNNSGQTIRTGTHEKGGNGTFPIYNHVKGGVYYVRFTSPNGKQETIKVVIMG